MFHSGFDVHLSDDVGLMWFTHPVQYYSTREKKAILPREKTQMNLVISKA